MTFLIPALAWCGIAAAAIPIIIHLLNRRRFTRVDWAPMKYLKLTIKSNRRKLQIEQLILLLLRILAMLLLFLTVARPMVSNAGFGAWLAGKQRKARVVVVDDTLSMSETWEDGSSVFDRAKSAAIDIVRSTNTADQLTVFTVSMPNAPIARQAQIDDPADVVQSINRLRPSHLMNQWAATFQSIDDYFQGAAYPVREAVLITDLKSAGWNEDVAKQIESWRDSDTAVTIIDVGRTVGGNLAVTELRQVSPVALAGARIQMAAKVKNFSSEEASELQATLYVDGQPQTVDLPIVKANTDIEVPLTLDIAEPGQHRVRFEIPQDTLNDDNQRYFIVDVRPSINIVMVDGDPRTQAFRSETDFIAASCRAGRAPWQVTITDSLSDLGFDERIPDVLVIANVGAINAEFATLIEKQVAKGMGLVIYPGDLVDPISYNNHLFKDGAGLLPAKLKEAREADFTGLAVAPVADSPLELLTRLSSEVLTRIKPRQILSLERTNAAEGTVVRSLAHWNDEDQTPALAEKKFGEGRVYLWTISADRDWSDWPQLPSFVLTTRQTMVYAATQSSIRTNLFAGQALQTTLPLTDVPSTAKLNSPGDENEIDVSVQTTDSGPQLRFENTPRAGFYQFAWQDRSSQTARDVFAVSSDPRESDPTRITEEKLDEALGEVKWKMISIGTEYGGTADRTELWRTGAMIFLGLIGCESLFAAWIGRER